MAITPPSARHSTVIQQFLRFLYQEDMEATDLTMKLAPVVQQPTEGLVDRNLHEQEVTQQLAYFRDRNTFLHTLLAVLSSISMRIEELWPMRNGGIWSDARLGRRFS